MKRNVRVRTYSCISLVLVRRIAYTLRTSANLANKLAGNDPPSTGGQVPTSSVVQQRQRQRNRSTSEHSVSPYQTFSGLRGCYSGQEQNLLCIYKIIHSWLPVGLVVWGDTVCRRTSRFPITPSKHCSVGKRCLARNIPSSGRKNLNQLLGRIERCSTCKTTVICAASLTTLSRYTIRRMGKGKGRDTIATKEFVLSLDTRQIYPLITNHHH